MNPTTGSKAGRPGGVRVDHALVRRYRERAGMTRDELAEVVGATARTLQRVENEGVIGLPLLKQVCEVLRVPVIAVLWQEPEAVRTSLRSHGLAPGHPPALVGRDEEIASLQGLLTRTDGPVVLVLNGPVGVGKTSLAQRLAQDTAAHFDGGVVWVRGDAAQIEVVQFEIARALGFEAYLPPIGPASHGRDWKQAFATHFWQGRRLLVLDDVAVDGIIEAFVAPDLPVTILATTHFKHIALEVATERVAIRPLPDAAISELLGRGLARTQVEAEWRCQVQVGCVVCQASPVPPSGAARCSRLLTVLGGMPGVARAANAVLRRERLTTTTSWLARFDPGANDSAHGLAHDRTEHGALPHYRGLKEQVSDQAWQLFAALGVFGSKPVPLGWAAAAGALPRTAAGAASELLDAHVVDLYHAPTRDDPEPWLRLAVHPAAAARSLLAEDFDAARNRVVRHVIAELGRARSISIPALAAYYRRHHELLKDLRQGLAAGLGPAPKLADVDAPEALAALASVVIDPVHAALFLDLITVVSPLLFDHTIVDAGECLGLGVVAARGLGDLERLGRIYLFAGWWRVLDVAFVPQAAFQAAALASFRGADKPLAVLATHGILGAVGVAAGTAEESAAFLADATRDFQLHAEPSPARSCVLTFAARLVFLGSTAAEPAREAARLCQLALDGLGAVGARDAHLVALLAANREAFLRSVGDDNRAQFASAVAELRARQAEPWLKAALLAHGASLGAALGFDTAAEARREARRELWECTRDCALEDAPRLLWFVAGCGFYELMRRTTAGQGPMVRGGLAGHGVPTTAGFVPTPELCGNDLVLMLSTEATGELLDLAYIDVALALAEHTIGGRLVSPALRTLRALLASSE